MYLLHALPDEDTININKFFNGVVSVLSGKLTDKTQKLEIGMPQKIEEENIPDDSEDSEMPSIPDENPASSTQDRKINIPIPPIQIEMVDSHIQDQCSVREPQKFEFNGAFTAVIASKLIELKWSDKEELMIMLKIAKEKSNGGVFKGFYVYIFGTIIMKLIYALIYW